MFFIAHAFKRALTLILDFIFTCRNMVVKTNGSLILKGAAKMATATCTSMLVKRQDGGRVLVHLNKGENDPITILRFDSNEVVVSDGTAERTISLPQPWSLKSLFSW